METLDVQKYKRVRPNSLFWVSLSSSNNMMVYLVISFKIGDGYMSLDKLKHLKLISSTTK